MAKESATLSIQERANKAREQIELLESQLAKARENLLEIEISLMKEVCKSKIEGFKLSVHQEKRLHASYPNVFAYKWENGKKVWIKLGKVLSLEEAEKSLSERLVKRKSS